METSFWKQKEVTISALSGLFYFSGLSVWLFTPDPAIGSIYGWSIRLSVVLLMITLFTSGLSIAPEALKALLSFRMSIDFLITVALIGALVIGKVVEAASLAFLYGVAELLEDYAMVRAKSSLQELLELSPQEATVIRDGEKTGVNVEDISVGETVVVRPGEKISMDGIVSEGTSNVNQAPVTGESMPVEKSSGANVFAGSFNEDGYLEIEVTKRAEDNTLAKIIQMVQEADTSRAPSQQFVDRFVGYYTPAVVGTAMFIGLVIPLLPVVPGGFSDWWLRAMALLVIACPCGLLISTPVTIVSGITSAAKNGTLIKGGDPFEKLGGLDVICFDKTGTLTKGEPSVSDVIPINSTEEKLIGIAAGLEQKSEHHLARAIVQYAEDHSIEPMDVHEFQSVTATGVSGNYEGRTFFVGKPELLDVDVPQDFKDIEDQGKTAVVVGTMNEVLGIIGISDQIRESARAMINELHELNIDVVMITGDNERTARSVAEELSIDHFHAELLPEDKVDEVDHLQEKHGSIAMVGDGINDAPALARADVGIAMGAAGSDTAIETADVALMGDDLNHVTYAVRLSRTGKSIIKQNIWSSIVIKCFLGIGVIPGTVDLITAVLVGDMGVSFGITGNAMRLRRIKQ